ncbi:kinesin motor domain-containing protein [Dunaliella salina]|uniref:Kinesin-like protein n=1 Tax=Dunaliella salina TaxID=3046 RepID=A0ABQ7GHI9_DUNSA|nr:kinesin motor domain-containing protein [Dunaliella salina]|eukprot:KAF5834060.1 kinesin motor domain-containing protein [Dunaliella salina]
MQQAPRVLLRIRPGEAQNAQSIQLADNKQTTVLINGPKPEKAAGKASSGPQYQFKFDSVLQSASQEEVYQAAAADVLKSALDGYNGTIMAYGQTGAGKTYTMSGGRKQSYAQRGLIPRVITQLFSELQSKPSQDCKVNISYLEIYNDSLYDLLDITTAPHEINVYEDRASKVNIVGLRSVTVSSEKEALALLFEGEANRVISEHQLNRESSRSHAIFTIGLEMRTSNDLSGTVVASKLNLVDLAGSERVSKTKSEGTVLKEAAHINKSLSILEQVVLALGEGSEHVPFRSSKLTHVLKDAVGGNCKTVMVANVWAESSQVNETLSTCRFAMRLQRLKCVITPNVMEDAGTRIRALQRQVKDLQLQAGGQKDGSWSLIGADSSSLTEQDRWLIRHQASLFLASPRTSRSLDPLYLASPAVAHEALLCVRELYQQDVGRKAMSQGVPPTVSSQSSAFRASIPPANGGIQGGAAAGNLGQASQHRQHIFLPPPAPPTQQGAVGEVMGVGEVEDDAQGMHQAGGVGVAPEPPAPRMTLRVGPAGVCAQQQGAQCGSKSASAAPSVRGSTDSQGSGPLPGTRLDQGSSSGGLGGVSYSRSSAQELHPGSAQTGGAVFADASSAAAEERRHSGRQAGPAAEPEMNREAAWQEYQHGPGAAKAGLLLENRGRLKELKRKAKELGLSINAAKHELDSLKGQAETMKAVRQGKDADAAQVLGTDEFNVLMRIKELKTQYKDQFGELQMVRSESDYTQQLCDTCAQEIVEDFNAWYSVQHGGSDVNGIPAAQSGRGQQGVDASAQMAVANNGAGLGSPGHGKGTNTSMAQPAPVAATRTASTPSNTKAAVIPPTGPNRVGATLQKAQQQLQRRPPVQQMQQPGVDEMNEPGAVAFYAAQNASMGHAGVGGHRPGSIKKRAGAPPPF